MGEQPLKRITSLLKWKSHRVAAEGQGALDRSQPLTGTVVTKGIRSLILRTPLYALALAIGLSPLGWSLANPPLPGETSWDGELPVSAEMLLRSAPLTFEDANPESISGSLMICGGGRLPDSIYDEFVRRAGGSQAHLVVIPTASLYAGTPEWETHMTRWRALPVAKVDVLHTRSRDEAQTENFCKLLEKATGVWFTGGNQSWITSVYSGTKTEACLRALLDRGGVIGGTSAGAAIMSKVMISSGKTHPQLSEGMGFLEGAIVDQHFLKRNRQTRLKAALELRPGHLGLGVDEGTALIVEGRTLRVIGESEVVVYLPASEKRPLHEFNLKEGPKADYVALCRAAIERANEGSRSPVITDARVIPVSEQTVLTAKKEPAALKTSVTGGTLVIVGGGVTPKLAIQKFIEAAGGPDSPMVVISNALGEESPPSQQVLGWLQKAGAKNVRQIHARSRDEAEEPELAQSLKDVRGIWFTGGRQWRLVDRYLDTPMVELFHQVLNHGGVIGGSSAGASIQGEYLVRGNPLDNREISGEGYERGFGFLPGVAIDQHFSQRQRLDDLLDLKKRHPDLVALGIDESTAVIVRGSHMEVVGEHTVTVLDQAAQVITASDTTVSQDVEPAVLKSGEVYDFAMHKKRGALVNSAVASKVVETGSANAPVESSAKVEAVAAPVTVSPVSTSSLSAPANQ